MKKHILAILLIGSFVLLDMTNKEIFLVGPLMVHEWIIILLFLFAFSIELVRKTICFTWVDKIFFIYFICAIIIPSIANHNTWGSLPFGEIIGFYLPIKTWMVYRIVFNLIYINIKHDLTNDIVTVLKSYFNLILLFSFIAAVIGILRIIPLGEISRLINLIWPIKGIGLNPLVWGRLVSTMSDTNGSALFFAVNVLIAFYFYVKTARKTYLYLSVFFAFIMLLTGSFSGIIGLAIVFMLTYRKHLTFKLMANYIITTILLSILLLSITPIYNFATNLIEQRKYEQIERVTGFLPLSFRSRMHRWPAQLIPFYEKPVFGVGPQISNLRAGKILDSVSTTNPHNYYVYILIHSGIIGLLGYLLFKCNLLIRLIRIKKYRLESEMIIGIILLGLITQISQLSFQYGGYSEIFGVIMAFSYFLLKSPKFKSVMPPKSWHPLKNPLN